MMITVVFKWPDGETATFPISKSVESVTFCLSRESKIMGQGWEPPFIGRVEDEDDQV